MRMQEEEVAKVDVFKYLGSTVHCVQCNGECRREVKKRVQAGLQKVIAVFVFSVRGVKMLVECLQICAHVFIDRPQNSAQTS